MRQIRRILYCVNYWKGDGRILKSKDIVRTRPLSILAAQRIIATLEGMKRRDILVRDIVVLADSRAALAGGAVLIAKPPVEK